MSGLVMAPVEGAPLALPIGSVAPPVEGLLGTDGRRHGIADGSGTAATVVVFSSNRCPTAKAYDGRMNALVREYAARGVAVIAINSNDPHLQPDESYARMVDRASDGAFTFPYVVDPGQSVAKAFGASCTFHVFLLDGSRRLRYQGRFDDSRLPERVTSHDLLDALDDVLAGRPVRRAVTRPFGCSLDFV
ncbi:MAG TPA: thioredoxin family protein [Candidatus Limnocylindrales bacterium]